MSEFPKFEKPSLYQDVITVVSTSACPDYIPHAQTAWFEKHCRPVIELIEKQQKEIERLKKQVEILKAACVKIKEQDLIFGWASTFADKALKDAEGV